MRAVTGKGRTWLRVLVVVLAVNVFLSLSPRVALWWDKVSKPGSPSQPVILRWFFDVRPDTGEADIHVVLWFAAALVAAFTVRSWRARRIVLGLVLLGSALIEVAQSFTPHRTAQWGDVLGNAIGVGLAGGFAWLMTRNRDSSRVLVVERAVHEGASLNIAVDSPQE